MGRLSSCKQTYQFQHKCKARSIQISKFSKTVFILDKVLFARVCEKLDKFSLTRSLVQKLVMLAFQHGNLLVCTTNKENLSRTIKCVVRIKCKSTKTRQEKNLSNVSVNTNK